MAAARTRYELRVGTVISEAALATFGVPVRPTAVPRRTVYRFRVPADRDLSEVLDRLTECDVQILEIRRCPEPRHRDRGTARVRQEAPRQEIGDRASTGVGVVLPLRAGNAPSTSAADPADSRSSRETGFDPPGGRSAG